MIRSRHENRKPFAPNFLKIPTHQHRCNKVISRLLPAKHGMGDCSGDRFDRSVDVAIGKLRRKLCDDPRNPEMIVTMHGVGYVFAPPVETV